MDIAFCFSRCYYVSHPINLPLDMTGDIRVEQWWIHAGIIKVVASAVAGAVVTLLLAQLLKRRGRFLYSVRHTQIGMSADDEIFGNVRLTWNDHPVANLFLSTIELKNESLNDFKEITTKVYTNDTTLLTERTEVVGTTEILHWSSRFREILKVEFGQPTPAQTDIYNKSREYTIPTMNRGQVVRLAFLNAPPQGLQPTLWLDIVHPGVKLEYRKPYGELLGVSQPASAIVGFILGLMFLGIEIYYVKDAWLAAVLCFILGSILLLPGALLIKGWYRLRDLLGS